MHKAKQNRVKEWAWKRFKKKLLVLTVSYTKLKKSLLKRKLKRKSSQTKKRHPNRKNRRKSLKLSKKKRMMMTKTLTIPLMLSMERTTINNSLLLLKRNQTVKSLRRTLTRLWLNLTQNLRKQRRNLSLRRKRKNKRRLAMTQVRKRCEIIIITIKT